jgi:hypothetical protein
MGELNVAVDVAAPAAQTWATLVDWPSHGRWMVLTAVERLAAIDGNSDAGQSGGAADQPAADGPGARIVGITGIGPFTFRDPMTFTQWQPPPAEPARCVVRHDGLVVRGAGAFEVEAIDSGHSRVIWTEWVQLPFGVLGALGWLLVKPVSAIFLRVSLRRFARYVESGSV